MQTYKTFAPTGFDTAGAFLPDQQAWLVAPCGVNRDSDALARSNYAAQMAELQSVDPEGNDWEEHSFGHWACGHFEIVIIRPGSPAETAMEEIESRLSDYAVLDEEDWSAREYEEACDTWDGNGMRYRMEMCVRSGLSMFAARQKTPPGECLALLTGC